PPPAPAAARRQLPTSGYAPAPGAGSVSAGAGSIYATRTVTQYDENGNAVQVISGQAVSNVIPGYAHPATTLFAYDDRNRVTSKVEGAGGPEATQTTYTYDQVGNVL